MPKNRINIAVRMQHWMDSVPGQTFLNYAYSWGASIVILGTLFKLTHLPGADLMLFIGMGTEVVVFFLSAFDRPFDRTEENKELAPDYLSDEEIEEKLRAEEEGGDEAPEEGGENGTESVAQPSAAAGQTIIIGGGAIAAAGVLGAAETAGGPVAAGGNVGAATAQGGPVTMGTALSAAELAEATKNYMERLESLNEVLSRVEEQTSHLTLEGSEMSNLSRTLTGINTVYELQLKGVSSQISTIEDINLQTRRMAEQIEELNKVYARMIEAMTVNMKMGGASSGAAQGE